MESQESQVQIDNVKSALDAAFGIQDTTPTPTPQENIPTQEISQEVTEITNPIEQSNLTPSQKIDAQIAFEALKSEYGWDFQEVGQIKQAYEKALEYIAEKEAYESKLKSLPIDFTAEHAKILELYQKGSLADALALKNTDFSTIDDKSILKYKFEQENKDMPKHLLNHAFEKQYEAKFGIDDMDSEEDIQYKQFLAKKEAEQTRQFFNLQKEELFKTDNVSYRTQAQNEQDEIAEAEAWIQGVDKALDEIGGVIQIGDGEDAIKFMLDSDEKKDKLVQFMDNPSEAIYKMISDGRGGFNHKQLAILGAKLLFGDEIEKVRSTSLIEKGKLAKIVESRNSTPIANTGTTPASSKNNAISEILKMAGIKPLQR